MRGLERSTRFVFCLLLFAIAIHSHIALAEIAGLGENGWHTWQVEGVESAPEMCCYTSKKGTANRRQCDLDRRSSFFISTDDEPLAGDDVQVYAHLTSGNVTRIRVFSSQCPVTADAEIKDLGIVDTDDSVAWLRPFIADGGKLSSDAIAAVAVHDGNNARDVLIEVAKSGQRQDDREEAIFWMGQVRVEETATVIKKFIFDDEDPDIREHAAFSYSQSNATDITEVLVRQGRNDNDPDVRSQAWFWLAQTEAVDSEAEIRHAILNDKDDDVREQAVFALSQLPEQRAVKALASILEDRRLDKESREQALFWLAQTDSDEAYEYIDRLLSDN